MNKRTIVFIRAVPVFIQALLIRILPAIIHVNTVNKNDLQNTHTTINLKHKRTRTKMVSCARLTCYSSYNSPPHPESHAAPLQQCSRSACCEYKTNLNKYIHQQNNALRSQLEDKLTYILT